VVCEACVSPYPCLVYPLGRSSLLWLCLHWSLAANLELGWTKGYDKLGEGVTQESQKKLWYEFPTGSQNHNEHRERMADRDEEQGSGTREGGYE
jgi:hypothetical protein